MCGVKGINSTVESLDSPKRKITMYLSDSFPLKIPVLQETRGLGKLYEEILCSTGFLPSHLLIQQSVYIICEAQGVLSCVTLELYCIFLQK